MVVRNKSAFEILCSYNVNKDRSKIYFFVIEHGVDQDGRVI